MNSDPHSQQSSSSHPLGKVMTVVAWILFLLILTWFFRGVLSKQENPNQQVFSRETDNGLREVELVRNRYGHYVASGSINGNAVEFMLDTGATAVSIPSSLASQIGLTRGAPLSTLTANGAIITYATVLDSVKLGNIVINNVHANINPNSDGILLGMSFLKQLEFTQRGNKLTLRQYTN